MIEKIGGSSNFMEIFDYEKLRNLQIQAFGNLLNYIEENNDLDKILDSIDVENLDPDYDPHLMAIYIWLAFDYIHKDGFSFVEKYIQNNYIYSSSGEIDILKDLSETYNSIYKVLEFDGDYVLVKDILTRDEYRVLEPNMANGVNSGEFIFARIGKVLSKYLFIGDTNFLPDPIKDSLLQSILMNFNSKKNKKYSDNILAYLKNNFLEVYIMYYNSVIDVLDTQEDIHEDEVFYDIEDFYSYLELKNTDSIKIKQHISDLLNFYDLYLEPMDMSLLDIDTLDIREHLIQSLKLRYINTPDELNSTINTLIEYGKFLANMDSKYVGFYSSLLQIGKDRFTLMKYLKNNEGFNINRDFSKIVFEYMDDQNIDCVNDFSEFLGYMSEKKPILTEKKGELKKITLIDLQEIFKYKSLYRDPKNIQRHFPVINFLFHLSLNKSLLTTLNNKVFLSNLSTSFVRLLDEDKFTLLFDYLWSDSFVLDVLKKDKTDLDKYIFKRSEICSRLSILDSDKNYNIVEILPCNPNFISNYGYILDFLGIIDLNIEIDSNNNYLSVTELGINVFKYICEKNIKKTSPVLYLDDYRKN